MQPQALATTDSWPVLARGRLYADLRHVGPRGAHGATEAAARLLDGEEQAAAEADPEEPHEDGTGLDLAAALLVVAGAEADTVGGQVGAADVAAVDGAQLGGQDDSADEGEEDGEDVEGQHDDGAGERGEEGGGDGVEADDPREDGDEHGEVDGGLGGAGGVDVGGDDVADEGGDEERPEEGGGPEDDIDEARHGDGDGAVVLFWWLEECERDNVAAQRAIGTSGIG
ncbi:hypothetical protein TOPH_05745 [Tolypocladium ophioglossoides CBS 100239]|uniref:Uncharacterized protein n=1 Tax=Tolypocladium ophioglossoides (strain CBS 100239) TaxID=1163406 RepID=A0A0L0N6U8_TOLOC|nr:hypothetical protein TOPH_05745 [Tolypocladium ophioglossoides CBS 100239]